jgi:hypothetical protein
MQQQMTATEHAAQRLKARGRPWPPGTSGNPLGATAYRRSAAELFAEVVTDFGGVDGLSATDRVLLAHGCRLLVRASRVRDHDIALRMSGEARRVLAALKRAPAPAPETPAEYLTRRVAEAAGASEVPGA